MTFGISWKRSWSLEKSLHQRQDALPSHSAFCCWQKHGSSCGLELAPIACDSKFLQYQESWGQVDIRWVVLKRFWWEGVFKPWIRQTLYTRALHPQERVDNIHQPPLALSHYSTLVWALCLAGFYPLSPCPPYIYSVCVYYKVLRKGSLKKC